MDTLKIKGALIEKFETQEISEKFKKREFVIETKNGEYSEQIKFELIQDKTNLIDSCNIGDTLDVSFNLKGRKWNDKYFTNLQAWRIERETRVNSNPAPPEPPKDDSVDLPF